MTKRSKSEWTLVHLPKFLCGASWELVELGNQFLVFYLFVCLFLNFCGRLFKGGCMHSASLVKFRIPQCCRKIFCSELNILWFFSGARLKRPSTSFRISSIITMAQSVASSGSKKCIRIDISSDTVCPWCFVGKKNLDKAIASSQDQYDFEIRWYPFFLNPSAPKEGINKREFYRNKFGPRSEQMAARMAEIFTDLGLVYDLSGLTGNTLDSHRLLYLAGTQGLDKQHDLAEELFLGYFTQGKYVGDREFLLESSGKVGVEGAAEFLEDPSNGLKEVNEELQQYSTRISGVPHYVINRKYQLSGGQPTESFLKAFQMVGGGDA